MTLEGPCVAPDEYKDRGVGASISLFNNGKCVSETRILVAHVPPQGLLASDHAGLGQGYLAHKKQPSSLGPP